MTTDTKRTTFFNVINNWDDRTLSWGFYGSANPGKEGWCNDGRDTTTDRATAERMMSEYLAAVPEDAGRVQISSYEVEA